MLEDDVVKNYLDCGLDGFGLGDRELSTNFLENSLSKDDSNYSLDESVGIKF